MWSLLFKMIKTAITKKIVDAFAKFFNEDLLSVILYGSYAEDRETPYSDIDIFIIVNRDFADWREKRTVEAELRRVTLSIGQISPKVMTPKELSSAIASYNPLALNIILNGKILYDAGVFKKAKEQFKKLYGEKINKTEEGYWEVAV